MPADPTLVFEKDPGHIWAEVLQSLDSNYKIYADMPIDPNLN